MFSSSAFMLGFFPIVFLVFIYLNKIGSKSLVYFWIIVSSLFFYSWWKPEFLLLLLLSVVCNYLLSRVIQASINKGLYLFLGIVFNLLFLFSFKYFDFAVININNIFDTEFSLLNWALPLAISFYTFQQIAYLADTYKGVVSDDGFKEYLLFVTFFPQLIIGPIVHHSEMMPQFKAKRFGDVSYNNFVEGFMLFYAGLLKKVVIADGAAQYVNPVYANISNGIPVDSYSVFFAILGFSIQIYFDFSGYTDMARGIAKFFGIDLPINFDAPYKSRNLQDFWRSWHMTLSRWLRDYLYVPLGGNKKGNLRAVMNAIIVFLLGGLWHGAAWTFVFWGGLQGIGLVVVHILHQLNVKLPRLIAISICFIYISLSWVFFRASDFHSAVVMLQTLIEFKSGVFSIQTSELITVFIIPLVIIFLSPTSTVLITKMTVYITRLPKVAVVFFMVMLWFLSPALQLESTAEFIYFDF